MHVGGAVDGVGHTLMIAQSPQFAAPTVLLEMALYAFSASKSEQEYAAQLLAADTECAPSDTVLLTGYLAELGLETLAEQAPESLSAGQARRLAIARTLARTDALYRAAAADEHHRDEASARQQPRLSVLVDEPTAHLDVHAAHLVTRALAALAARGANVLIVTHEGELAEHCALWLRAEAHPGGGYRWALKTNPAPAPIPASAHTGDNNKSGPAQQPRRARHGPRCSCDPHNPARAHENRCAQSRRACHDGGSNLTRGRCPHRPLRVADCARRRRPRHDVPDGRHRGCAVLRAGARHRTLR